MTARGNSHVMRIMGESACGGAYICPLAHSCVFDIILEKTTTFLRKAIEKRTVV